MKTRTDNYLMFAKIFLGMFITAIAISFLILLVVIIWGAFDPTVLAKSKWEPDLAQIRNYSLWSYYAVSILFLTAFLMYFLLFFRLIKITSKINLEKPFDFEIPENMQKIAIYLIAIFL